MKLYLFPDLNRPDRPHFRLRFGDDLGSMLMLMVDRCRVAG